VPVASPARTIFEDLPIQVANDSTRGRITLYCTAEAYDRKRLEATLKSSFHPTAVMSYPDAFYLVSCLLLYTCTAACWCAHALLPAGV
jgi:hypothetical protein